MRIFFSGKKLALGLAGVFVLSSTLWAQVEDPEPDQSQMSEPQFLQQMADIYRDHATLLEAKSRADYDGYEVMLDEAVNGIEALLKEPGMNERDDFRELYRTVVTEYQNYYGVQDTLVIEQGDIFAYQEELFAELDDDVNLEDVTLPDIPPMRSTIPLNMNRRVQNTISYMLRTREDGLDKWRVRAEMYFPMIEQVLREEDMPAELKYLAVIESGLNPNARSRARAVGMWQFIAATGRSEGLVINNWVDERRDPEKATRAAIIHLRKLKAQYGTWHKALAGYNCSPRAMNRAIRRAKARGIADPDFWDIYPYLPRETRGYVPNFIAAALMMSNPSSFNLGPATGPRYEYDMVPIQQMMSLATAAQLAGTDVAVIRALNPEILTDAVPPSENAYMLRIPYGRGAQFAAAYAELDEKQKTGDLKHAVARGETLNRIARRYGVSQQSIRRANNLSSNALTQGQTLIIPVTVYTSKNADAMIAGGARSVQYGTLSIYPLAVDMDGAEGPGANIRTVARNTELTGSSSSSSSTASRTHRVTRGQTLSGIASRYGVTVSQLRAWNNISGSRIRVGQRLRLYGASSSSSSASGSSGKTVYHVVRRGDTLGKIAAKYGVSVSNLKRWNGLRSSKIIVGKRLTVQSSGATTTTHRVQRGDTLGKIAVRYGVSISNLKRWNGLRSSKIMVGQRLKING